MSNINFYLEKKYYLSLSKLPLILKKNDELISIAKKLSISRESYINSLGMTIHNLLVNSILEKLPDEVKASKTKKPPLSHFLGKNVLHDYQYRSGWYAVRVITPHEYNICTKIFKLVRENNFFVTKIENGKEILEKLDLSNIIDVAYPYSYDCKDLKNKENYRGYIFLHLNLPDSGIENALIIENLRQFLKNIENVIGFVGFNVPENKLSIEQVVSFASGKQKINTYRKNIVLPSKAKDTEVKKLKNTNNSFSVGDLPELKPGFVLFYVNQNGKHRKVVITGIKDNNTYLIRYLNSEMRSFPVSRDRLLTKTEKKNMLREHFSEK